MHLHILGICGTFMGSLALLAREQGLQVSGSDAGVYPPMSTQLQEAGITLMEAMAPTTSIPGPTWWWSAMPCRAATPKWKPCSTWACRMSRGLSAGRACAPGAPGDCRGGDAWQDDDGEPGCLVAGGSGVVAGLSDRGSAAQLRCLGASGGAGCAFVVEADEYDTAFFDKRSKFVHYRPEIAILGNLEFDHADIFPDLAAIERQFHHLVRTVPGKGRLLVADGEPALDRVLEQGCWTPVERFGQSPDSDWQLTLQRGDAGRFDVSHRDAGVEERAVVDWP